MRSRSTRLDALLSRLRPVLFPLLAGSGLATYTLGALSLRVTDREDLLSPTVEAALLGLAFGLASAPTRLAIAPRAVLIVPTFFLYLSIFVGKAAPLPFPAAFAMAGLCALVLTALSSYFSERARALTEPVDAPGQSSG